VKVVVHWFQMMSSGTFRMYEPHGSLHKEKKKNPSSPSSACGVETPQYLLKNITIPKIVVCMGGRDSLPDNEWLMENLPQQHEGQVRVHHLDHYEHLDFIWADNGVCVCVCVCV
jgi:hypothetical protein